MVRPVDAAFSELALSSNWLATPFFAAALLAGLTLVLALRGGAPGSLSEKSAATLLAVTFVLGVAYPLVQVLRERTLSAFDRVWVAWFSIATAAGVWLFARARRCPPGWARWLRLLAVFTALASPLCVFVLDAVVDRGPSAVGPGGWLYVFGIAALAGLAAWGIRPGRS